MNDIFKTHASLIVSGTGNNNFIPMAAGEEADFLSWYKPRTHGDLKVVLKYFNIIYSTGCSQREKRGGRFTVTSAFIGGGGKISKAPDFEAPVFFGGEKELAVSEGFQSDETEIFLPEGAWLSVRLKIRAEEALELPTTDESASSGYRNGLKTLNVLRPNFIGYRADFAETLVFFGDSITQGTATAADKYQAWSHRTGLGMPPNVSVINLGMGWSRAYDAAADGIFTALAKKGTRVIICFGVNDIKSGGRRGEEVIADLKKIVSLLRENNPKVDIILCTVPPFNLEPWQERQRQKVNKAVLGGEICQKIFDIAAVLEEKDGRVKKEYMSFPDNAHPNGLGGAAVAAELRRLL